MTEQVSLSDLLKYQDTVRTFVSEQDRPALSKAKHGFNNLHLFLANSISLNKPVVTDASILVVNLVL
jgi:hypothetical protein